MLLAPRKVDAKFHVVIIIVETFPFSSVTVTGCHLRFDWFEGEVPEESGEIGDWGVDVPQMVARNNFG